MVTIEYVSLLLLIPLFGDTVALSVSESPMSLQEHSECPSAQKGGAMCGDLGPLAKRHRPWKPF